MQTPACVLPPPCPAPPAALRAPPLRAWLVLGGECRDRPARSALAWAVYAAARTGPGPAPKLLLSGAGPRRAGGRGPGEAEAMAGRLRAWGVPAEDLLIEPRALDTLGNLVHGAALAARHGLPRPGLITDAFHARRCAWLHRRVHGVAPPALLCTAETGGWRLGLREPMAAAWLGLRLGLAGVAAGDAAAHAAFVARAEGWGEGPPPEAPG